MSVITTMALPFSEGVDFAIVRFVFMIITNGNCVSFSL